MLAFNPNKFFNELERTSSYKRRTLEQAARRAIEKGLIEKAQNQSLALTKLGQRTALPYAATKIPQNGRLMIIFDVPEDQSGSRKKLRTLLKKWSFVQAQKSVWITEYDHRQSVKEAVAELDLDGYVELYECASLPLN